MTGPYQLYRDLEPAVEAALRAGIKRFGVLVPVAQDQHGNILDGHQRVRLADLLGLDYPVKIIEVADEDEAREIARMLNEDRRAMPKEQRLPVEVALREEGHSLRAIAGAVGVGVATVHDDLAGVRDRTPAASLGLDGKSYPSRREPRLIPAPVPKTRLSAAARAEQIRALAAEGHNAAQIAEQIGICTTRVRQLANTYDVALPDFLIGKVRHLDETRIVRSTVASLEGFASGLQLASGDLQIDQDEARELSTSLRSSLRAFNRLSKRLQEMCHD